MVILRVPISRFGILGFGLVVVMMVRIGVAGIVFQVRCGGPLAGSASILVIEAAAETLAASLLLVPSAQRLAAKHEVVVFDGGDDHPWVQGDVQLDSRWAWNDDGRLGRAAVARTLRCRHRVLDGVLMTFGIGARSGRERRKHCDACGGGIDSKGSISRDRPEGRRVVLYRCTSEVRDGTAYSGPRGSVTSLGSRAASHETIRLAFRRLLLAEGSGRLGFTETLRCEPQVRVRRETGVDDLIRVEKVERVVCGVR
jgi:hypothetical protein